MNLERVVGLTGQPTALQLAANGAWEQAWRLRPGERPPSAQAVRRWLDRYDDSIALEVFAHPGGEGAFLGARLAGLEPAERARVVQAVVDSVSGSAWSDLGEVLAGLEGILPRATEPLLAGDPAWLELGVVNAWRSVGSQVLWRAGEPPPNEGTFRRALRARRQLLAPQANPLALEFAFTDPLPHWLGMPVSKPAREGHVLDLSAALTLSEVLLEHVAADQG